MIMQADLQDAQDLTVGKHTGTNIEDLPSLVSAGHLALRTYASLSEAFKRNLLDLGLDPAHVRAYRLARLPKHVWVVEVVDRRLRDAGQPCVLGEALVDATSSDNFPDVVAYRLHGALIVQTTRRTSRGPTLGPLTPTLPAEQAVSVGPESISVARPGRCT